MFLIRVFLKIHKVGIVSNFVFPCYLLFPALFNYYDASKCEIRFERIQENYMYFPSIGFISHGTCHLYYYSSGFNKVTLQSTHWSIQTLPISGGDSSCSWVFYSCTGPKCGVGVDLVDCNAVGGGHVATSIDQSVRISACGALALEEYKQSASVQPLLCSS